MCVWTQCFLMSAFQARDARVRWRECCREDDDIEVCKLNVEMELCVCVQCG